jgi:hypothetical protein
MGPICKKPAIRPVQKQAALGGGARYLYADFVNPRSLPLVVRAKAGMDNLSAVLDHETGSMIAKFMNVDVSFTVEAKAERELVVIKPGGYDDLPPNKVLTLILEWWPLQTPLPMLPARRIKTSIRKDRLDILLKDKKHFHDQP